MDLLRLDTFTMTHGNYPSDAADKEWAFAAPYLNLCRADTGQRRHKPRAVFDAMRWVVRAGAPRRMPWADFPPWAAVFRHTQRWLEPGMFEAIAHDLHCRLLMTGERGLESPAAIPDARMLHSAPESGGRAGYDGAKRTKGLKLHAAVDTQRHLLDLHVAPADTGDRSEDGRLTAAVYEATGHNVKVAFVDRGYTGERAAAAAEANDIALAVVRLPQAKRGFILLPRRWVVKRSFPPKARSSGNAWASRFRRLSSTISVSREHSQNYMFSPSYFSCDRTLRLSSKVHNKL